MEHVKPIGPLRMEGNIAENWRKWKQRWILYAKASGVDAKDEETQCAVFLDTIGDEALEVYDTFSFAEAEGGKIEPLLRNSKLIARQRRTSRMKGTCSSSARRTADRSTPMLLTFA